MKIQVHSGLSLNRGRMFPPPRLINIPLVTCNFSWISTPFRGERERIYVISLGNMTRSGFLGLLVFLSELSLLEVSRESNEGVCNRKATVSVTLKIFNGHSVTIFLYFFLSKGSDFRSHS